MLEADDCGISAKTENKTNYKKCDKNKNSEYNNCEDVEGWWGYVVCVGLSAVFVIGIGPMSSIALLYGDFLKSIGEVTRALTLTFGIGNAMVAFAGMLTTCVLKKYSLREVGLFGTAVYCIASFLAIFVYSMPTFIIVNGFIQPIGFGIIMPISLTNFNTYFHKKRASMMSIVSVIVGAGGMIFPILVEKMMETYGFRGTLALLCAINMNVIPGVAVMQPAKWHLKNKNKVKTCLTENEESIENKCQNVDENCNDDMVATANEPLLGTKSLDTKLISTDAKQQISIKVQDVVFYNSIINKSIDGDVDTKLSKSPSIASLGNRTGSAMVTEAYTLGGKWKGLIDFLDLKLLKDLVYCNICLGITLSVFADITFFTIEPAMLSSLGYDKIQIAYCITIGAFADLISRIIFAFASFCISLKSRAVFFIGNACMIVFRIAFVQGTDLNYLMILTGCLGFFRHWILMNAPLVFADHCGIEKFPAAYGLNMMISGLSNLVLGPLTGFIKEMSNGFTAVIYYLIICSSLCCIPWIIEYIYKRTRKETKHQ